MGHGKSHTPPLERSHLLILKTAGPIILVHPPHLAGMTPFMASIEATKRAFGDADAAQRRRQRAARDRKGSDGGDQAFCASNGGECRGR